MYQPTLKFHTFKNLIAAFIAGVTLTLATIQPAMAEIQNRGVAPILGSGSLVAKSGGTFAFYFITLWRGVIVVGAIMILIYFLWGGIEWITAGGDSAKVNKARDRITQSIIGFIILVSTAVIIAFIGKVFLGDAINLFQLTLPTPGDVIGPDTPATGGVGIGPNTPASFPKVNFDRGVNLP